MNNAVLQIQNLSKEFRTGHRTVKAVDHVSFELLDGEVLGLVGESGSGKSTIARLITQIEKPDEGSMFLQGRDFSHPGRRQLRELRGQVQMVFQNAEGSFNPRMRIGDTILESISNFRAASSRQGAVRLMQEYLEMAGLNLELAARYPRELSGGQCQRAAIVRALAAQPKILICDEATSALDVLVQAKIVELLGEIRRRTQMSILFISHDLALVSSICDRLVILCGGRCVEQGNTRQILTAPRSADTKRLLESIL